MSRILALADTQLGVATVDLADQRVVLDRIVGVALDRKVDVVIHGGDVFEGPAVTPEQMRTFLDATEPLRDKGVPMIVLRGNGRHDSATRTVHALDVLDDIDGFDVYDRPRREAYGDINICCLPWVHPGRLIAEQDGAVDHDLVNRHAANLLVRIARDLKAERVPSVLVCHWAISGSALPTGLPVDDMHEPILPWAELDALGYDAILGAHIHVGQQISQPLVDKTLGIVVGSPQPLNFGEGGYDHGCWIVEVGDGPATAEFVPIESKRFETITLDEDWQKRFADDNVEWTRLAGDIVRVRYEASEDAAREIDDSLLRRKLLEAGASRVQIEPQIIRKDRARVTTVNEQLSQTEALAAWCDANEIDTVMRGRMIERLGAWA